MSYVWQSTDLSKSGVGLETTSIDGTQVRVCAARLRRCSARTGSAPHLSGIRAIRKTGCADEQPIRDFQAPIHAASLDVVVERLAFVDDVNREELQRLVADHLEGAVLHIAKVHRCQSRRQHRGSWPGA